MGDMRSLGWLLVGLGGFILLVGLLFLLAGKVPFLGRLPATTPTLPFPPFAL